MSFSEQDIRERRKLLLTAFDMGLSMKAIAIDLGYSHVSGLSAWMKAHATDIREMFHTKPHYRPGRKPLSREEAIARLKVAAFVEAAGFNIVNLAHWCRSHAPDGAAVALADYAE